MYRSCCSSHFFVGDQKPRPAAAWCEQRVELLCISSYEEKLYRTMDSTVLYWRIHSLDVYFAAVLFPDALCQKIGSHPVLWGRGPPNVPQRQVCIQGISTAVRSAGPCNMGVDLKGQAEKYQDKTPLQTPRAVILSFEILCFIKYPFLITKPSAKPYNKSYFLISVITILNRR